MIDAIKARLGSIPESEMRKLSPKIQQLLRRDLPEVINELECTQRDNAVLEGNINNRYDPWS